MVVKVAQGSRDKKNPWSGSVETTYLLRVVLVVQAGAVSIQLVGVKGWLTHLPQ